MVTAGYAAQNFTRRRIVDAVSGIRVLIVYPRAVRLKFFASTGVVPDNQEHTGRGITRI
jgi:hypothetical protein